MKRLKEKEGNISCSGIWNSCRDFIWPLICWIHSSLSIMYLWLSLDRNALVCNRVGENILHYAVGIFYSFFLSTKSCLVGERIFHIFKVHFVLFLFFRYTAKCNISLISYNMSNLEFHLICSCDLQVIGKVVFVIKLFF